jgi:hypothetical protein
MAHLKPTTASVASAAVRLLPALVVAAALTVLIVMPQSSRAVALTLLGGYAIFHLSGAVRNRGWRAPSRPQGSATKEGRLLLDLERTLIVATLDTAVVAREADLTPEQAARLWGAILVDQDQQTFRLLIAPPADGAVAAVHLLRAFYPVHVAVWQAPTVLTGQPASPQLRSLVEATLRASAGKAGGIEGSED